MKKILPISTPYINAYSNHAHIFSILGVNSNQHIPWIYNYYVQLYVPENRDTFTADYLIPSIFTYAPNLFVSRIERSVAVSIKGGIIDFLRYYINEGYYIYTHMEVSQIAAYNSGTFKLHDPLIYGYDDDKKEIYFSDIYQDGKYAQGKASYEEIMRAIGTESKWENWPLTDWTLDVVCMKYKDLNVHFEFNKDMYIELLSNYIEGKNTEDTYWSVKGWSKGGVVKEVYGIQIYSFLKNYVSKIKKEKGIIDFRGFYVILEHKQILEKTLSYLLGKKWQDQYLSEGSLLQKEMDAANIMLKLCVKYQVTKSTALLDKIIYYAEKMETYEKRLFPRLIKIIEACN